MSGAEVMKLTRMGRFSMDGEASGPVALLKRLRGKTGKANRAIAAAEVTGQKGDARLINLETGEIALMPWREPKSGKGISLQRAAAIKSPTLLMICVPANTSHAVHVRINSDST